MRNGCHRVWRAGRHFDAVLFLQAAARGGAVQKSLRLCRPDDAAVLSGVRVGAGTRGGVRKCECAGWVERSKPIEPQEWWVSLSLNPPYGLIRAVALAHPLVSQAPPRGPRCARLAGRAPPQHRPRRTSAECAE